ncbi:MAG: hypothetical protein Q9162_007282 [Coniocarpon cinnabarinum]
MDGVNGVTQCPIAPGDHFVYNFTATQYGSSWYHSHYSVQYADGAVGPLTLHGPTSAEFDEAISPPLIMTDWGHNSAFIALTDGLEDPDILLNGLGNVTSYNNSFPNTTAVKPPYSISFGPPERGQRTKKYLMRIINTSFDTTFVFSIDNHILQVVTTDFVPITPYRNTSILIGIGQRYNVIVEANPLAYNESSPLPEDGNYWIRTSIVPCGLQAAGDLGYERTGILRYNPSSTSYPSSEPWQDIARACADENYASLHPIVHWQVSDHPANGPSGDSYDIDFVPAPTVAPFPLALFALSPEADGFAPIRIDYSNPTFLNLDNNGTWDPLWRVEPEDYTSGDWVYLVIDPQNQPVAIPHPIHLHGHDFAILEQAYNKPYSPNNLSLHYNNPPRRDVVLVPPDGYVVIAFKTDNPGAWLVHCHIAFHISRGLGMQILENQEAANAFWPKPSSPAIAEAQRVCANWQNWYSDTTHWDVPPAECTYANKTYCFQDDSGV